MPTFDITAPNGQVYKIEGASAQGALAALQQHLGVADQTGIKGKTAAFTTSALDGIPVVGPAINAATDRVAAFAGSLTGNNTYDQELARIQGVTKDAQAQNPGTALAGSVTGGVLGTVPLVVAAPAAFGAGAGGLGMRSAASMVSSGLLGGADTAVRSGGDPWATLRGGGLSASVGLATPFLAGAAGRGVGYLADKVGSFSLPSGPLAALPKPAVNYALDIVGDPAQRAALQSELNRLGPQATLADVSPEWLMVARGAASRPGARDEVVQPLLNRDAGKNIRLGDDLNASLGPAPVPSRITAGIEANQENFDPLYRQVLQGARAVDTTAIAHGLEADAINLRGPAQQAVQRVRQMLNVAGETDVLDPNPYTLWQTRQAIDGLMQNETNGKVIGALTNARQQIDTTLAQAVPGFKDVDAMYAELARQNTALTRGQQVLDSGRTAPRPQEVAQEVAEGALPQGNQIGPSAVPFRLRQGARAEIDRVTGTNSNDPAAMQRLVKSEGDWNRDRLRSVFGQENADTALNAIDRETRFYQTKNRVSAGSDTAAGSRFGDFLDQAATPTKVPVEASIAGLLLRGAQKAGQAALGSNAEARAAQYAQDLGKLSVAQGDARDRILTNLLESAQRKESLDGLTKASQEIARLLLLGQRPPEPRLSR